MFLTILTRTFNQRPVWLKDNQAVLQYQTCKDFEQKLIVDDKRRGVAWANANLRTVSFDSDYGVIVDDDDTLAGYDSVEKLKDALHGEPFAVVKTRLGENLTPHQWKERPRVGGICSCSVVVRRDVWEECKQFWGETYTGDFDFINALFDRYEPVWIDQIFVNAWKLHHGMSEQDTRGTMKVLILESCGGLQGQYYSGEIRDLDAEIARELLRCGRAKEIIESPEEVKPKKAPRKSRRAPAS